MVFGPLTDHLVNHIIQLVRGVGNAGTFGPQALDGLGDAGMGFPGEFLTGKAQLGLAVGEAVLEGAQLELEVPDPVDAGLKPAQHPAELFQLAGRQLGTVLKLGEEPLDEQRGGGPGEIAAILGHLAHAGGLERGGLQIGEGGSKRTVANRGGGMGVEDDAMFAGLGDDRPERRAAGSAQKTCTEPGNLLRTEGTL